MAKLKVKQIEDLSISTVGGVSTIQIGPGDINSVKPLLGVSTTEETGDDSTVGYISGLSVLGNDLVITRTALPGITVIADPQTLPEGAAPFVRDITTNGHTITKTMGSIGNGLAIDEENGVLNLNLAVTPAEGTAGQVISGLSYANGVLAPDYSTVAAADVTIADAGNKFTAENVEAALAELAGSIAAIDPVVTTVAAGNGISVIPSATTEGENDVTYTVAAGFTVTIENLPESDGVTAGTYIVIKGNGENGQEITKVNANSFVKDGFLQKVELIEASEGQENVLRFTWNSDAGIQVTDINVSDLCDVYTADETYLHLNGFKFEHKTSDVTAGEYAANAADVTVNNTTSQSFKVPTLTVDAAGHVTAASEKTVTIDLPDSIDTAVQTVTKPEGEKYLSIGRTNNDVTIATVTGSVANGDDKLATAANVKEYVDSKVSGATEEDTETLEFSKVVKGTRNDAGTVTLTPGAGYTIEADSVCVYINGQLIPESGYSVNENTVTVNENQYDTDSSVFTVESTDRIDVVAHATKTVTLTYLKLKTAQNSQTPEQGA